MKLEGVIKGSKYYQASGIHKGIPYRIVQDGGRFLLERVSIGIGVGPMSSPVGFFGNGWEGIFSWERK